GGGMRGVNRGDTPRRERTPALDLHREPARPQRQGMADRPDGSGQGEDSTAMEDTGRSQPLRSGVGTVPGRKAGLETGRDACRAEPDRVLLEGTRGPMRGVRPAPS